MDITHCKDKVMISSKYSSNQPRDPLECIKISNNWFCRAVCKKLKIRSPRYIEIENTKQVKAAKNLQGL